MTEQDISQEPQPDVVADVGERLMKARLARQLTIEEVAGQLHLQVRHLDALEQQDLSRLPGPSYICGYLRAYAKFLNLPSNEIVENYPGVREHIAGVKSTVVSTKLYTPRSSDLSQPRPAWLGAAGMLATLLVGAWLVFQMTDKSGGSVSSIDQPRQVVPSVVPKVVTTPAPERVADPNLPVQDISAPASTVSADVIEALPPSTPVSALVLEFTGDSWVEIYDAGERRLVYEAVHAGETRVVKGQAPFKLMLGAVKSVQVRLNGAHVDMTPHQQRESAVFQVGSAQDNRIEPGGE
ncbi:MAG: helix-turn-helix domain-containing protein [Gammaproteobacteria bacterium]|nr:helix-turn-helix domain-containing protein [Gammaproteobacteria bacterium]